MHEQLLAARNSLMGTTNILLIGLPDNWRLIEGHAQPEVDRWTEYQDRRWMSQGHGLYRLVEPHPAHHGLVRCEVELVVTAWPQGKGPGAPAQLAVTGRQTACGHEASVRSGTLKRGFWPRLTVPAMTAEWSCAQTARQIRLVLQAVPMKNGPSASSADLENLLAELVAAVQCH